MIRGIHHTAISTPDLDRLVAFYRDLLGFEVLIETEFEKGNKVADLINGLEDCSARIALLRAGNIMMEFFQYSSPSPKTSESMRPVCDHGITHIAFDVTDLDAEYERLKSAGMHFHCPPQDLGIAKTTYGRDPDGNVIELQELSGPDSPIGVKIQD